MASATANPDLAVVGGLADDRRATNLDRYQFIPEDQEPDQTGLIEGGWIGGEGGRLGGGA